MDLHDAQKTKYGSLLIQKIQEMVYPPEFGAAIASGLGTVKSMSRMLGYLSQAHPGSAEEIADEMLAICDDRDRWIGKKKAECYNAKYNELLWHGLDGKDDDRSSQQ